MSDTPLRVLCVVGSSSAKSDTQVVLNDIADRLRRLGAEVDLFIPHREPLRLFNPESSYTSSEYLALRTRVDQADTYVLGTPDYHGSISSTLKNFLDHFWKEFAGKLFAPVVGSHEKGLTVLDQLHTVARQCNAWSLPYGVSFASQTDVTGDRIVSAALQKRIEMFVHDIHAYGVLLRRQRRADLAGSSPGFLARLQKSD